MLVGYFNCSEVRWETYGSGGENTRGSRLLTLIMNNTMLQWVTENTRYKDDK